jgi:hypothetical protein
VCSGELVPAVQGKGTFTSGTAGLLTSTRSSCTVPRRKRDDAGGDRQRRGGARVRARRRRGVARVWGKGTTEQARRRL